MPTDGDGWRRTPGAGRYARAERERRFLVVGQPAPVGAPRHIEDRYLDDTRLRLRKVAVGDDVVFKLTQKVRREDNDPSDVGLTTMYLSLEEYQQLVVLGGHLLVKTRHLCEFEGSLFAVDEFAGPLTGLWLAEVEVEDLAAPLSLPTWVGEEVTHDDRFSGGRLARATPGEVAELLDAIRGAAGASGNPV